MKHKVKHNLHGNSCNHTFRILVALFLEKKTRAKPHVRRAGSGAIVHTFACERSHTYVLQTPFASIFKLRFCVLCYNSFLMAPKYSPFCADGTWQYGCWKLPRTFFGTLRGQTSDTNVETAVIKRQRWLEARCGRVQRGAE